MIGQRSSVDPTAGFAERIRDLRIRLAALERVASGLVVPGQLDDLLPLDGSSAMTGDLDLDGHAIINQSPSPFLQGATATASGTLANNSVTVINSWNPDHDPDDWVNGSGEMVAPTDGLYIVSGIINVGTGAGPSNVTRLLFRLRTGSTVLGGYDGNIGRHNPIMSAAAVTYLAALSTINLQVLQSSGESKPSTTYAIGMSRLTIA